MSQPGTEKSALQHAKEKAELLTSIRTHIGGTQAKIDVFRKDSSDQVQKLKNRTQLLKGDKRIEKEKKDTLIAESSAALSAAQAAESKNQAKVTGLVAKAESYLKERYEKDYFGPISENCKEDRENAKQHCQARVAELDKKHEQEVQRLRKENAPDLQQELKDENYVYKNKFFDAKMTYEQELQAIKDRRHEALAEQYHIIDLLRMPHLTFAQEQTRRIESYRYISNQRQFLLENGLYVVIVMIFITLSIVTPIVENTQLFTYNNTLNVLRQASSRMLLALGIAGLVFLTGTDLSTGCMTGMGMVAATIIMHRGVNTSAVFGKIFDFTSLSYAGRAIFALLVCIVLTTYFTSVAGFFTARFKIHPFISTMSNMLITFGLTTYATKGVSFGAIELGTASMVVPKVNGFPLVILWAVTAITIIWFIQNKTRFGKDLYAISGNPEAVLVSGISVFTVTMGAFMMAGVFYGFDAWLECAHMVGSGSAAYGQGWNMDVIAACMVDDVSFTGGIGKISGVVAGVLIFTALIYPLTILNIDTNLQFAFEGIIILTAVTLDCLKYIQKK